VNRRELEKVLTAVAVALMAIIAYLVLVNNAQCVPAAAAADERPLEVLPPADSAPRVEAAIWWQARIAPRHPVRRRPAWRRELSGYIAEGAAVNHLPWALVTAIAYREGSFRPDQKGDLGEWGMMQVADGVKRRCKAQGFDLMTPQGQIQCGTWWLADRRDHCGGNLQHGFAAYASGRVCRPDTEHLASVVWDRFNLARKYQEVAREHAGRLGATKEDI